MAASLKSRLRDTPLAWDWLERRSLARAFRERAALLRGRVLDIGCRDRPYRPLFHATSWIGLDLDADGRPDVRGDATRLPFAAGTFDGVFCAQVLDDLADPQHALDEVSRVLRPGGTLLLSAPQVWGPQDGRDYWRFTPDGLRLLAGRAGLTPLEVAGRGGLLHMVAQRLSSWTWHRTPERARPLAVPAVAALQLAGAALDRLDPGGADTLGLVLVARKAG